MTFAQIEEWVTRSEQPSDLDKKAYSVFKVLGRKHGFIDWWKPIAPETKEVIFCDVRDAIRYGDMT